MKNTKPLVEQILATVQPNELPDFFWELAEGFKLEAARRNEGPNSPILRTAVAVSKIANQLYDHTFYYDQVQATGKMATRDI